MTATTFILACAALAGLALLIGVLVGRHYAGGGGGRGWGGRHDTPPRAPELEAVESALDRLARRLDEAEALRRADQAGMRAELAEQALEEGKAAFNAVFDSAVSRVRPVSMAAITTILGMIPLLGDEFFASLAVVIMFGLGFATVLTLLFLPVLYCSVFNIKTSQD